MNYTRIKQNPMNKKTIYLFFLVIFSLKFFDAVIANNGILKNLCYAFMLGAVAVSLPHFLKRRGGFVLPVQLISGSILLSIFVSAYTWGQGLEYSTTTLPYLVWFTFFYLQKADFRIKTIENIVLFYGVVYMILFLFQFTHTSVVYFGMHEEFKEDRGIVRVNFPGGGVFFLACFIALNKITSQAKHRFLWGSYATAGVVIIVLQVTRQAIMALFLIYLIHFLRNVRLSYKVMIIGVFAVAALIFVNSGTAISKGLAEQQKEDAAAGGDYVRILEAEFFLTRFTPNTVSKVLGNGMYNLNSAYGKVISAIEEEYWYFLTDVGVVEVYVMYGVLAILGYLLIFIKSFRMPLPKEYHYLKYYLWMLIITCLTSDFMISYYFLITTVLVLYCYQKVWENGQEEAEGEEVTEPAFGALSV